MFLGTLSLGVVYLIAAFTLFVAGKFIFDLTHRGFDLKVELVERDNLAMALTMGGYLIGLTLALGGVLSGPTFSLVTDLIDIFIYGSLAVVLLNVSARINDWLILGHVDAVKEIVEDRNCGVGMILAANHVAMGLIVFGAVTGEGGGVVTVLAFWLLGQATLILAGWIYNRMAPFDVRDAIEKDNTAVGIAFSGMLLSIGNIIRVAEGGNFVSWSQNLGFYATVILFGLLALPAARFATDRLILPGRRLTDELVNQEHPNLGAGVLEAVVYFIMSFLIGWCID